MISAQQFCLPMQQHDYTRTSASAGAPRMMAPHMQEMARLASTMVAHMCTKASSLVSGSTAPTGARITPASPPSSPQPSALTAPHQEASVVQARQFNHSAATLQKFHSSASSSVAAAAAPSAAAQPQPKQRYAPYQRRSSVPHIRTHSHVRAAGGGSLRSNLMMTHQYPVLPVSPVDTPGASTYTPSSSSSSSTTAPATPILIKTTTAESLQIQKIAMTALTTLRLPSHTIVLALYFVHKLLTLSLPIPPHSLHSPSPLPTHTPTTTHSFPSVPKTPPHHALFSTSPVGLFLAGLMLADTVLCDAPVSVSTWTWILEQSCPPFSLMARQLPTHATYARDVKKWGLTVLVFDVGVGVEVYQQWLEGVRMFLEMQGAAAGVKKGVVG
ncbi:hypothetical protein HDU98_001421 [Podochytrium sp. JEL0797]|nr:hypothetical protein HDU98_001421 [Podochytrium sp. JEL0797]